MNVQAAPRHVVIVSGTVVALGAFIVATTIWGIVRWWSPLPWWDTWDGILASWYRFQDGDFSALWAQHNEHRIVLGRLVSWLDLLAFDGAAWSVMAISLVALALSTGAILALLKRNVVDVHGHLVAEPAIWGVMAMCVILCWSWLNAPNILWVFQVSFLLVQILTLACFTALAAASCAVSRRRRRWLTAIGIGFAALAPWSIPAGLLTPLVAAMLAAALRLSRWAVAALVALTCASVLLYELGFDHETFPLTGRSATPMEFVTFTMQYIGGPIVLSTGSGALGVAAGCVFILLSAWWTVRAVRSRRPQPAALALAAVVVFSLGNAFVVALGRANRGVGGAVPERYQSLVLLGWACLIALYAPTLVTLLAKRPFIGSAAVLLLPLIILLQQPLALVDAAPVDSRRARGALAVSLQVADREVVDGLYPGLAVLPTGARLMSDGLTAIGSEPYGNLLERIGTPLAARPLDDSCTYTRTDSQVRLDDGGIRIEALGPASVDVTAAAPIIDGRDVIVGFADVRPSTLAAPDGPIPSLLGYLISPVNDSIRVVLGDRSCAIAD